MNEPDFKLIKKLALACRKAGIKEFKGFGMEFSLHDIPVRVKTSGKRLKQEYFEQPEQIDTDGLTQDQLLMWSVGDSTDITGGNG